MAIACAPAHPRLRLLLRTGQSKRGMLLQPPLLLLLL
jgi:hypothetical protein